MTKEQEDAFVELLSRHAVRIEGLFHDSDLSALQALSVLAVVLQTMLRDYAIRFPDIAAEVQVHCNRLDPLIAQLMWSAQERWIQAQGGNETIQ